MDGVVLDVRFDDISREGGVEIRNALRIVWATR